MLGPLTLSPERRRVSRGTRDTTCRRPARGAGRRQDSPPATEISRPPQNRPPATGPTTTRRNRDGGNFSQNQGAAGDGRQRTATRHKTKAKKGGGAGREIGRARARADNSAEAQGRRRRRQRRACALSQGDTMARDALGAGGGPGPHCGTGRKTGGYAGRFSRTARRIPQRSPRAALCEAQPADSDKPDQPPRVRERQLRAGSGAGRPAYKLGSQQRIDVIAQKP